MKSNIFIFLLVLLGPIYLNAQNDSVIFKKQKALLFISKLNPHYDWKGTGHVITEKMFSDFFFPIENLLDTNIEKILKNKKTYEYGIKLYKFSNRNQLKSKAKKVFCQDSSGCYSFGYFYAIAVEVQYKLYSYNQDASVCGKHFFELKTKDGSYLHFSILNKGISDLEIKPMSVHTSQSK